MYGETIAPSCPANWQYDITIPENGGATDIALVWYPDAVVATAVLAKHKNVTAQPTVEHVIYEQATRNAAAPKWPKATQECKLFLEKNV